MIAGFAKSFCADFAQNEPLSHTESVCVAAFFVVVCCVFEFPSRKCRVVDFLSSFCCKVCGCCPFWVELTHRVDTSDCMLASIWVGVCHFELLYRRVQAPCSVLLVWTLSLFIAESQPSWSTEFGRVVAASSHDSAEFTLLFCSIEFSSRVHYRVRWVSRESFAGFLVDSLLSLLLVSFGCCVLFFCRVAMLPFCYASPCRGDSRSE